MRPFARLSLLLQSGTMASTAAAGLTLTGTEAADTLNGAALNDTLIGLGGADTLNGAEGNDRLEGGEGNDILNGGDGDDVLEGGNGNDLLNGDVGNDTLRGGEGDDELYASYFGSNVLEGGAGKDRLRSYGGGNDSLAGGDGDDTLLLMEHSVGERDATITLSGGAGNDFIDVRLVSRAASVLVSGGDGADRFSVGTPVGSGKVKILDFGATDQLDLREWLPSDLSGNPFGAAGNLKAVQEGADVAIYVDRDGAAGPNAAWLLVTLANVSLDSLSAANFAGGYDPRGGNTGPAQNGTPADDVLTGGTLNDTIDGGEGNDQIDGRAGDDTLRGGAGRDTLAGGAGKDALYGDGGDDSLDGGEGDDLLEGGDGKDFLSDASGSNDMRGGEGDDTLRADGLAGSSVLDGGAGNDTIVAGWNAANVRGGSGDDAIGFLAPQDGTRGAALRAEGGDGRDTFTLRAGVANLRDVVLAGGAGADRYVFDPESGNDWGAYTIADFQTGSGGDLIDLFSLLPESAGSPVASGHVRMLQDGARVLLQVDRDGSTGPLAFETRIVLENTSLSSLGWQNFSEGVRTDGSNGGMELGGSGGADRLEGGRLDDTLRGEGGADVLLGNAGNDTLFGGDGDDRLDGGAGSNTLYGGAGNDLLESDGWSEHRVFGEAGNDRLVAGGRGVYDGGAGDDRIEFYAIGQDPQAGAARLRGGDGADLIRFGSNSFVLDIAVEGGAGADVFMPASVSRSMSITDFTAGSGGDVLDVSVFRELSGLTPGANPFTEGLTRLVQRDADTWLQLRVEGAWVDSVRLQNVDIGSLREANFAAGMAPTGLGGGGNPGGAGGTAGPDVLRGGDGKDTLLGLGGDDQLYGNGGADFLYGGAGNDRLEGGEGDDVLDGEEGDDELLGGAGNDTLGDAKGSNILRGGDGNDVLSGSADGRAQVFGEAGDDTLYIAGGSGVFDGGAGNDSFTIRFDKASAASLLLTGGAGSDSYTPRSATLGALVTVTDFAAGANGDFINLTELGAPLAGNPFVPGGSARLLQRGADTVLQSRVDKDGVALFEDILVLRNVAKDALTSDNFLYAFHPNGDTAGYRHVGSDEVENVFGTGNNDVLRGGGGNDTLTTWMGRDLLEGGAGDDHLDGGAGIDTALFSGARQHYALPARLSQDMVVADQRTAGGDGKDRLVGIERLVFQDGAIALDTGADGIAGQAYRIYRAAFDREPDQTGLGFWIEMLDRGVSLQAVADGFTRGEEFAKVYGANPGNADIVTRLYRNILDREPEKGGYEFWLSVLDNKLADLGTVLAAFSESPENRAAVAELIANGVDYQPFMG